MDIEKKFLTFLSGIRIITNGKFKKKIFGFIGNGTSSLDGYEQHKFLFMLFMYYLRRIFYAKKQVSGSNFYDHHGICDGLRNDLLQYCIKYRDNDE